ncbi:MAG: ribonuclease HI family protein [Ignavibacteriales bacterium]|nr:ribonuclease HI family protein [Ignavibacteriales bacterium]
MTVRAFTDGASRGNPGRSGIGYIVYGEDGATITSGCDFIGNGTNNIAEYTALITCLRAILAFPEKPDRVVVHADSELMVRQLNGVYRVKDEKMKKLHREVQELLRSAPFKATFTHVPRSQNKEADGLANQAIDEGHPDRMLS